MSDPLAPRAELASALHVALACLSIAVGGLLLGLQVDRAGDWHGTCLTALGSGALIALLAAGLQARGGAFLPRDLVAMAAVLFGFAGVALVVSAVLVPSGPWLFAEVLVLLALLARGRQRATAPSASGPELSVGAVAVLALMLLLRLWITYRSSVGRSELASVDVPLVSAIPFSFLDPLKSIDFGAFRPEELCLPAHGPWIDFQTTSVLWAAGFALCVAGRLWLARAAPEHENDRVHATIHQLPPALAALVEKLLPEEDWQALGLHGLSERRRRKRLEQLFRERLQQRREFDLALQRSQWLGQANPGGFAGEILTALERDLPTLDVAGRSAP